jgi:hypothetical protein
MLRRHKPSRITLWADHRIEELNSRLCHGIVVRLTHTSRKYIGANELRFSLKCR